MINDALPIFRFLLPEIVDMPIDIREKILAVQEKVGVVSNVFLVLANRSEEFRVFSEYHVR